MNRRKFVGLFGALTALPLAAKATISNKTPNEIRQDLNFVKVPDCWTPKQIAKFQAEFDRLSMGTDSFQKIRFILA